MIYTGGCHCGKVRFEVDAPESVEIEDCNCSICAMSGHLHLIVPRSKFRVTEGEEGLTLYQFNSRQAQHYHCSVCGIKPFYVARSNPDGIDVNLRCLDRRPRTVTIVPFDGQNWEANAAKLAHKSQE